VCYNCGKKGGAEMAQGKERKESTNLTLSPEIKKIGLEDAAKNGGMSLSSYISMLIAKNHNKKG
jgi:hypothetical protein